MYMGRFLNSLTIRRWMIIGLLNLVLVSGFGLLMRFKVLMPLPFIEQKQIMHAHSHFAFSGWLSHVLMLLFAMIMLHKKVGDVLPRKYQLILLANLVVSYGMLITFTYQGYGGYSIFFSILSILLSYVFAYIARRDLRVSDLSGVVRSWLGMALFFLVLSSLGTFYLAYLVKTGNVDARLQLAAVYFFLHFQYNGWFFFMCMGLANHWLDQEGVQLRYRKRVFQILAWACIPGYLLSVLWYNLPMWLYVGLVVVVMFQLSAWTLWLNAIRQQLKKIRTHIRMSMVAWLFCAVLLAASIKFLLQTLSVIPSLSSLAYSFRPIVVGYLHLVLLGIITFFILAFIFQTQIVAATRKVNIAMMGFIFGVVFNELLLLLQGAGGILGVFIPHIPLGLGVVAVVLFISLLGLLWAVVYES